MMTWLANSVLYRKVVDASSEEPAPRVPDRAVSLRSRSVFHDWRDDVACVFLRDPAARTVLEVLTTYPGVHAILLHRVAHRWWVSGWRYPARVLASLSRFWTNIDIHPGATIGRRFFIDHGAGVVIGETAEVGDDVTLYHGVTLGGTSWNKGKRHPTVGHGVLIGAGAKILGPIVLGDNVRVGANSVVVKSVPANRTVVGIPGKVVQSRSGEVMNSRGLDLDHHRIPDVVSQSLTEMQARIETLENIIAARDAVDRKSSASKKVA